MTTKQTETMTDVQAFCRRFESLAAWGIRINGLDGNIVDLVGEEYFDEQTERGHFTYVSHDADGVTVEVGLPDRDPYKDVVIPFAADGDEVERLLLGAIRECEKAEEALTAPETPAEQPQETEGTLDPAMQKFIDHYNALISTPVRPPAPSESPIKPDQGNPESPLRALFWAAHDDGFVVNPNGSAVDIVIEQPIVIGHVEHGKFHDDGHTFNVSNAEQTISVDVFIPHNTRMHAARHIILKALKQAEKALATPETPTVDLPQEPEWVAEIRKENAERKAAIEARLEAERKTATEHHKQIMSAALAAWGLTPQAWIDNTYVDGWPIAEVDGLFFTQYTPNGYLFVGLPCPDLHAVSPDDYDFYMWRMVKDRGEIPDALDSARAEISTARARINRPVAPPKPKVEVEMIALHEGGCGISEGVAQMKAFAAEGYKVAGFDGGWVIMQGINEEN